MTIDEKDALIAELIERVHFLEAGLAAFESFYFSDHDCPDCFGFSTPTCKTCGGTGRRD